MTTTGSTRPVLIYLGTAFAIALGIALALPHMGIATLLSALTPVVAVAITIMITVRSGERRAAWAAIGWRRPSLKVLGFALLAPAVVTLVSFGLAAAIGVVRFSGLQLTLSGSADLLIMLVVGSLLFLGEEIGWRGFLYPRLSTRMPRKRAAIVTGAIHAAFHLPLLLLTTTYQTAGNRLIVVPMVMVTICAAGVIYAWIREIGDGVWAVSVMHNAFNTFMETAAGVTLAGSAATLAYVTTETGVFTLLTVLAIAAGLLTRDWGRSEVQAGEIGSAPQTSAAIS